MIPDKRNRDRKWCGALILILAVSPTLTAPRWSHGQQQSNSPWLGKRVVQRHNNFPLRMEGEAVLRSGTEIDIYRVERAKGKSSGS